MAAVNADKPKPMSLGNPEVNLTFSLTTNELADLDATVFADSTKKNANTSRGKPADVAALTRARGATSLAKRKRSRTGRVARSWAPSSIAMAVTSGNPDASLTRLINWAERHEATIRFHRRKESSVSSDSLLPDLGEEQRRLQIRIQGNQLAGLMSHMTHGSTSSQLVRQPRKQLSDRELSKIRDLSDYIAQEVPITPSSLRLCDKQSLTLDIILRLPPTLPQVVDDRE
jgi:hypothetical protein